MLKHRKLYSFIVLIITVFVLWFLLKDNYKSIIDSLLNANYLWIFITIIVYFLYFLFDVLSFTKITNLYTNKVSFFYQLYIGIVNRFVAGITPLSTGGQPVQVYELHRKGVDIGTGTNIAFQSYMVFQLCSIIYALISIIINSFNHYFKYMPLLSQMTIIGFILNLGILILLIITSFNKEFNYSIVKFIINILYKLKIVKYKDKQIKKWNEFCDNYYNNAQELLKNKKSLFIIILYEVISITIYYSIPYFIIKTLNINTSMTLFECICASSYVFVTSCYVPIPGATGGTEYAFNGLFGNFISDYKLSSLLILWRSITYYIPVIVGAILFNILQDIDVKKKRIN